MFHENRPYDHLYDPVFMQKSGNRALYRSDKTVTTAKILGSERCKYFSQSNKQFAHTTNIFLDEDYLKSPTSTHLKSPNSAADSAVNSKVSTAKQSRSFEKSRSRSFIHSQPFSKSIGTQTDYRDSQIQTDPYSPEYTIIPDADGNTDAPLLAAQHLNFKDGTLPAGYDEVEALEREVIKKQILAALPKGNDKTSLGIRRRILSQIEASDWEYKEIKMKREQHERYLNVVQEMKKRDEMMEKLEEERLNKLRMDLHQKQQKFDAKMEQKRIKALRKISTKHSAIKGVMDQISKSSVSNSSVSGAMGGSSTTNPLGTISGATGTSKQSKPSHGDSSSNAHNNGNGDIIDQYYHYSSELYAPITRKGIKNINGTVTKQLTETMNTINKLSVSQAISKLDAAIQSDLSSYHLQIHPQSTTSRASRGVGGHSVGGSRGTGITAETGIDAESTTNTEIQTDSVESESLTSRIRESVKMETKKYATRAGQKILSQLDHMNNLLKATYDETDGDGMSSTGQQINKRFENIYKTFNPIVRPPTPTLDASAFNIKKMDDTNDIMVLQSMMRGRATQNQMYCGKEKRLELIKELQIREQQRKDSESRFKTQSEINHIFNELAPVVMDAINEST